MSQWVMNLEEPTEPEIKMPIFTIGYGNRNHNGSRIPKQGVS
jgi:hypothetical protein